MGFRLVLASALLVLSSGTAALADAKTGYDAWERGDFAMAIANWRPLAIAGDAEAQYNLGQAYRLGRGVPLDLKQAEDWFRKAALQGNEKGKGAYGIVLFQNGKRSEALPYLEDAAGAGNPNAQYILGTVLFNGELMPRDWPRAYALMTRASASGIAPASSSLAQMDKIIPLDQRTRGLALARAFELSSGRPASVDIATATPPSARLPSGPVRPVALPPSEPVGLPGAPEPIETPSVRPIRTVTAKPPVVKPPLVKPPVVAIATPRPMPIPTPAPAPRGNWRVQLGAFADGSKAGALWNGLRSRIGALGPYQSMIVKAGPITRLQAGPLGSRAAAEKLCASVKAAGQACLPVAP